MSDEILSILAEQQRTLGRIEAGLGTLVGNGQPGVVKEMKDDIDSLKQSRSWAVGFGAAIVALEGVFHYLLHKLGLK